MQTGDTKELPIDIAGNAGHVGLRDWLHATDGFTGLRTALSLRLHDDIREILRRGLADPDDDCPKNLKSAAAGVGAHPHATAACAQTVALGREMILPWSIERHMLYHAGVRIAIKVVLLCCKRLENPKPPTPVSHSRSAIEFAQPAAVGLSLPRLPTEMWLLILQFLQRRDFPVVALAAF